MFSIVACRVVVSNRKECQRRFLCYLTSMENKKTYAITHIDESLSKLGNTNFSRTVSSDQQSFWFLFGGKTAKKVDFEGAALLAYPRSMATSECFIL